LDTAVRQALAAATDEVRASARGLPASWVPAENLHLTLKFLGAVDEAKVPPLISALHRAAASRRVFDMELAGLGAFPSPGRVRIVWAGVTAGAEALRGLAQVVDDATADLGFPREERAFSAHVTLARVREPRRSDDLADALGLAATRRFGTLTVTHATLVRSDLSPRGARYTSLEDLPLEG